MPTATFHFPPDFRWGVATAAHQVEGNNTNNQWWAWEQQEGRIKHGHTSGLACDWWEHAEADFDRAAAMGLNTLRLSIEWSRVEPKQGFLDPAALERYRQMLAALQARGILPMVTLHHFSDPLWLHEMGGWENPEVIPLFVRYVEKTVKALGEYTNLWCTINEPNVYTYMGYLNGAFPPGKQDFKLTFAVLRNLLLAHGQAYRAIHRLQPAAQVGLAHNYRIFDPYRAGRPLDKLAAGVQDWAFNRATLDTLRTGWWTPPVGFGPIWALRHTLDWIGINYYSRDLVQFDPNARDTAFGRNLHAHDAELLDGPFGELYPHGLYRAVTRVANMKLPIYITEHGLPDADDDQRPRALVLHLHQLWRVLQGNYPVKGYYHWTLTDNFEWVEGWEARFGLIELDPETQVRRNRPSADLYATIVRGNAITPELLDAYTPELRRVLLPA